MTADISVVPGLQINGRRTVALLRDASDVDLNGAAVFDALDTKDKRNVLARMDYWIAGGTRDEYFHGWPQNPDRKHCFVFKWKRQIGQRLYGFLCNPDTSRPEFRLCVLCIHSTKTNYETDSTVFTKLNEVRQRAAVVHALRRLYPPTAGAKR
jgi:hypothetical protein